MFTLKHLKQYKKRPICIDVTSNKYLYFNDVVSFKNKISKIKLKHNDKIEIVHFIGGG